MKYIRTQDGIYELVDFSKTRGMKCINHYGYKDKQTGINMLMTLKETKRYKQADTIEELCDEFVLHYGDTMETNIPIPWASYERRDDNWSKNKEKLISELNNEQRKATVYGAIWTDKGLIYVTKMNEKGELELL